MLTKKIFKMSGTFCFYDSKNESGDSNLKILLYEVLTIYEVYSYYEIKETDSKVSLAHWIFCMLAYKIPRGLEILDDKIYSYKKDGDNIWKNLHIHYI